MEGIRQSIFLDEVVEKYHRTFETYINTLIERGFTINNITEAKPSEEMLLLEGMKDELRRPMILIIKATK